MQTPSWPVRVRCQFQRISPASPPARRLSGHPEKLADAVALTSQHLVVSTLVACRHRESKIRVSLFLPMSNFAQTPHCEAALMCCYHQESRTTPSREKGTNIMLKWRGIGVLATSAIILGVTPCAAADICEAVLSTRSFDTYETTTLDNLATRATEDICNTKWSSKDDFTSRVRKWDSSFSYLDIFKGTGNADVSGENRTVDQDYQQFCKNADNSYLRNFFTKSRTQLTDTAVKAWENCIKTTQETGLFSRSIVSPDRTLITIAVRFRPSGIGDKLILKGYDNSRYTCSLLGQDVVNFDLAAKGLGNSVDIACFPKDPQSELHIAINTSQNQTIGPFIVPSKAYLALQESFAALSSRADELDRSLAAVKADGEKTRAAINEQFKKLSAFTRANPVGFDSQAVVGGTGTINPQPHDCAQGQFVAGINTYVEDGHIKMGLNCMLLPVLQFP
jgi:hypothetical protein